MDRGRLVGRADAVAAIEQALAAVGIGSPPVVRVAGEPGIGKSRLLAELAARADAQGMLALEGRAAEFEQDLPFGLFVDALDDCLAALGPRPLNRLKPELRAQLGAVFPALAGAVAAPARQLLDERYLVHRAVRALLDDLGRTKPLVLALDDVHWADPASRELLMLLIRNPPAGRVLVALAHRPAPFDAPLAETLDRATRDDRARLVELEPLSEADAEALLGAGVPASTRTELYEESGGNPFYLQELARAAAQGRRHRAAARRGSEVPSAVAAAIERELAALGADERSLLQGAAVAGEPFDVALAAVAAATPEDEALAGFDRLVETGLVRTTDVPRRLAFRHPVVRRAVYESAGPGWRLQAHRRLVAALSARGASASELARHVEAAAEPGDASAVALLTEAGGAVVTRAPAIAARHYEAAVRLLPEDSEHGPQRLELLSGLAGALGAAGDLEGAHRAVTETLALMPPELGAAHVRMVAYCAAIEHLLGRYEHAQRRLHAALERVSDKRSAEAATLLLELAAAAVWSADFEQVTRLTDEARDIAIWLDEPALQAQAAGIAALGDLSHGPTVAARARLEEGLRLADALPDRALATRLDALFYLAYGALFRERYTDCLRMAERAQRLSRETAQGHLLVQLTAAQAAALVAIGRIREAGEAAEDAFDAARLAGNDMAIVWAGWVRCTTALHVDVQTALKAGEDVAACAARVPSALVSGGAGWIYGAALLDTGDPGGAREHVLDLVGGPELPHVVWSMRCLVYELLARADLALGDLDAADGWVVRAERNARPLALGVAQAHAGRARAAVALARGQPAAAARVALAAAEAAERQGAPVEAARARTLAGRALAAAGDPAGAAEQLERSRAVHEHCGATRHADEAIRELRRLGRRIGRGGRRSSAAMGVAALSGRELEIAELVANGLTNRQIGETLFLSEKTVETHLSRAFRKLDVSSRAAVGRALAGATPRDAGNDRSGDFPDVRDA